LGDFRLFIKRSLESDFKKFEITLFLLFLSTQYDKIRGEKMDYFKVLCDIDTVHSYGKRIALNNIWYSHIYWNAVSDTEAIQQEKSFILRDSRRYGNPKVLGEYIKVDSDDGTQTAYGHFKALTANNIERCKSNGKKLF